MYRDTIIRIFVTFEVALSFILTVDKNSQCTDKSFEQTRLRYHEGQENFTIKCFSPENHSHQEFSEAWLVPQDCCEILP